MLSVVVKFIVAMACILGTFAYSKAIILFVRNGIQQAEHYFALGVGALLYTVLWVFYFSRQRPFWSIIEHELTHALFALLSFRKVQSFQVDRATGGEVKIDGDNFLIALSPYFFPMFTVFLLLIKPSFGPDSQAVLNVVLGFSLMFHFIHLSQEFHPSQPDLQKTGMLFALVVVFFFNVFFLGVSIASLNGNWLEMEQFIGAGLRESQVTLLATLDAFLPESFASTR